MLVMRLPDLVCEDADLTSDGPPGTTRDSKHCPRSHHRGTWKDGSPPLDRFTDGSGWACPGIAPDGSACGYELRTSPVPPLRGSELREHLGRVVREAWVACAYEQDDPKPSHLAGWDELDEWNKEVDRRIGDAVTSEVARLGYPHE
jgi:hypothetical protein